MAKQDHANKSAQVPMDASFILQTNWVTFQWRHTSTGISLYCKTMQDRDIVTMEG